jgi:hypothetical protein
MRPGDCLFPISWAGVPNRLYWLRAEDKDGEENVLDCLSNCRGSCCTSAIRHWLNRLSQRGDEGFGEGLRCHSIACRHCGFSHNSGPQYRSLRKVRPPSVGGMLTRIKNPIGPATVTSHVICGQHKGYRKELEDQPRRHEQLRIYPPTIGLAATAMRMSAVVKVFGSAETPT